MKKNNWCFLIHLSNNMWNDFTTSDTREYNYGRPISTRLEADKAVWDEVTEYAAKEGCDSILIDLGDAILYESHPEIAVEGAWTVEYLKEELNRLRSLGLTPYPKLNFSAGHDAWLGVYSRMVSTPTYYEVCKDLINEVIDIFDTPELFHIGMDEEYAFNQQNLDFVCYRQFDLLWKDMRFFCDCVRERNVRPWMWSDHFWKHPKEFAANIGTDVLVSPWRYLNFYFNDTTTKASTDPWEVARLESYTKLPELGYDIMPCFSNFHIIANTEETVRFCKENVPADKMPGFLIAPWFMTVDKTKFDLLQGIHLAKLARDQYGY